MIKELIKIANELDGRGLMEEADSLDKAVSSHFLPSAAGIDEDKAKILELLESDQGQDVLGRFNITIDDRFVETLSDALKSFKPEELAEKISIMALSASSLEAAEASQFSIALRKTGSLDGKLLDRVLDFAKTTIKQMIGTVKYLLGPAKLWKKVVITGVTAAVGTGYLASPVDFIPDFILGLGQIDDIVMYFKVFAYAASKFDSENWLAAMGESAGAEADLIEAAEKLEDDGLAEERVTSEDISKMIINV